MRDYRNHAIVFFCLTTAAAGFLAWQKTRELSLLRNTTVTQPNVGEMRRAAWASGSIAPAPESKSEIDPTSENQTPSPETPTRDQNRPSGFREGAMLKLLDNPEYVRLLTLEQKARLDPRYAALFKQLGLAPEVLEKFKDLLVEKQSALIDAFAAARSQGLDPRQDREVFRELATTTRDEIDESIRAMLGDADYATYHDYEQTLPYRNLADQLQTRLSYSPSPLTSAQTEQLVKIMAANTPSGGTNRQANPTRNARPGAAGFIGNPGPVITETTVLQAGGILTPDQQAVLQQMQAEQAASQKLRELTRGGLNPANPAPPVK